MKNLLILFFVAITSFSVVSFSAEGSQKYVQISNQKQTESDKIIIYEFFWYGCPHCYNIEPTINQIEDNLKKDTILIKVPVALRNTWEIHAKAYYTLQQMKLDDDLHEKIFSEIHVNANRLDTEEKLINFLNDEGPDAEEPPSDVDAVYGRGAAAYLRHGFNPQTGRPDEDANPQGSS